MSDLWEIFALKYAERGNRTRADSFIADPHHDLPHEMDYYVWVLRQESRQRSRVILVDTGYDTEEGVARCREIQIHPAEKLRQFGISPEAIDTIILTHLHYDHAGSLKAFPNADLHVQALEMSYATGPCMCHDHLRAPFTGEHICDMVRALFAGRVHFSSGSKTIAEGVETHLIGGHSRGLQCVRVKTARGWVVLASDASHYYENYRLGKPFPIVVDVEDMLTGFQTLKQLAESDSHIIPGHDPIVRSIYQPVHSGDDSIVALHVAPKGGIL
uniref:N-acyl homoserine lactonase family protein n=1 Tax=Pararhizobium sp. IMCC3301 TaxID=3067904 RepID=UPI00274277DB|nr:N-acyl homoserine lactonase family protein [Pararhizobium sp. IMCC3301]